VKVIRAVPADATAIAELHVATWRDAYRGQLPDTLLDSLDVSHRSRFWSDVLDDQHNVLIAIHDSVLVGFCSLIPSRDSDGTGRNVAEIAALYVSSKHWRRGVGSALCDRAFKVAADSKYSSITLWVLSSNTAGIHFYEAIGFTRDGTTKAEVDSNGFTYSEIRMRRELNIADSKHE
jgi:ribosomal protein S18 acetylase RimI-like enzyme